MWLETASFQDDQHLDSALSAVLVRILRTFLYGTPDPVTKEAMRSPM